MRPGLGERATDNRVELRVHLRLLPEVLLQALHPLEVGDDDAARIREHVGEDEDAPLLEDLVGLGCHRPVRTFGDEARLHFVRVLGRDYLLQGARRENVAVDEQDLVARNRVGT